MASGTLTTTGQSVTVKADSHEYHVLRIQVSGTWDGATVTLSERGADGTYRNIEDGAFTADASREFTPIYGRRYKLTLSAAGASTSLYCEIVQRGLS